MIADHAADGQHKNDQYGHKQRHPDILPQCPQKKLHGATTHTWSLLSDISDFILPQRADTGMQTGDGPALSSGCAENGGLYDSSYMQSCTFSLIF
jgi:hypothetical protein